MNEEANINRVHPADLLLIVVFCIAFFGFRLGSYVPLTDHEGYVAVTAQEAVEDGHWLVPHFDGQIRLQKTPLMYWTVALTGTLFGHINELVVRLPSALAASGIALILTVLGTKMFTRQTGVITGLATASTVGMLWLSHVGIADMLMAFFVVLSMLFFYLAIVQIDGEKPAARNLLLGYAAFGLGMLAKGPVPVITVAIPLFCYLLWAGTYNQAVRLERAGACPMSLLRLVAGGLWGYLKKFQVIPGVLIFLAILGAWVVPVLIKLPDAYWRWKAEYLERYLGEFTERRPFFYYFPQIFLLTLPWAIFLPVGLTLPFRRALREKRHELMFLFMWLVVGFLLFSLSGGKRTHYLLPVIPPAIMLSVAGMIWSLDHWLSRRVIGAGFLIVIVASIAGLLIGYGYVQTNFPDVVRNYRILGAVLVFGEIFALLAYFRVNVLASVTALALATGICFAILWPLIPRVSEAARDPRVASERIKRAIGSDAEIHTIGKADGPLIFYYGRRMPQIPTDREVAQIFKAADKDRAVALLQEAIADKVVGLMRQPGRRYFLASDLRYATAKSYARRNGLAIHEILTFPGFYSTEKSMVLFGNQPAPTTTAITRPSSLGH